MKLLTDLIPHFFYYGLIFFVCIFLLALLLWGLGVTISPFIWLITRISRTQCTKCKGLFKKRLVNWEILDEKEVLRTVNRVDQGLVYSNHLLEPDHVIEINRKEQVAIIEKTLVNHWTCKDPLCGHTWDTEEIQESEQ